MFYTSKSVGSTSETVKGQGNPAKFQLDRNDILNALFEGNCLEVLEYFPAHSVDMVLCDLPYGTTQSKWDSVIDLSSRLWAAYQRVIKPSGAQALHGS